MSSDDLLSAFHPGRTLQAFEESGIGNQMWKNICLILFFVSAAFVVPSALLGIGFNGAIPANVGFWLFLAIPLAPLYGWWRIKRIDVTPEDIERSR